MAKTFYTERDIEDLSRQGVTSLVIGENDVVTDAAREKARKLGVELTERESRPASAPARPYISEIPSPSATAGAKETPSGADLEARVYAAVKTKLGDQVDDALLRTIVKRVLKSLGKS
jgi:hypothetical protein